MYPALKEQMEDMWQGPYTLDGKEVFTKKEMACRCGCGMLPKHSFMLLLLELRRMTGPLIITSGARCAKHNSKVAKSGSTGPHVQGVAVDIQADVKLGALIFKHAFELGFTGFGVSQRAGQPRYVHIDKVIGPTRPALFSY